MARVKKEVSNAIPAMGHNNGGKRGGKGEFKSDLRSIKLTLTTKDKQAILDSSYAQEDILPVVADYLENGYKFSCSLDADNQTFIVTLTYFNESSPAHKHCLQGRGKELVLAWASMRYKDVELLRGNWEGSVVGDDDYGLG